MALVPHEDFVIPPLEAFLVTPHFVASDLWVWPLFLVATYFVIRSYHKGAGLSGRTVELIVALKALNGLFIWGIIIGLSNAVHRATDDVIVSGLWTGVALTLTTGGLRLIFKYSPIAPTYGRVQERVAQYRLELKEQDKARKQAKARGQMFVDPVPTAADAASDGPAPAPVRRQRVHVARDSPADARQQVSVLMRRDLFADPAPPAEPAPEAEKPPVS